MVVKIEVKSSKFVSQIFESECKKFFAGQLFCEKTILFWNICFGVAVALVPFDARTVLGTNEFAAGKCLQFSLIGIQLFLKSKTFFFDSFVKRKNTSFIS